LKCEAVRQGRTISELVETALYLLFQPRNGERELRKLPSFESAAVFVVDTNILGYAADGDSPYHALESHAKTVDGTSMPGIHHRPPGLAGYFRARSDGATRRGGGTPR
jgi:hypothetical protein